MKNANTNTANKISLPTQTLSTIGMFYDLNRNNDAELFYENGERVTKIDEDVYPLYSNHSARVEHPNGIRLVYADAILLGIKPTKDEDFISDEDDEECLLRHLSFFYRVNEDGNAVMFNSDGSIATRLLCHAPTVDSKECALEPRANGIILTVEIARQFGYLEENEINFRDTEKKLPMHRSHQNPKIDFSPWEMYYKIDENNNARLFDMNDNIVTRVLLYKNPVNSTYFACYEHKNGIVLEMDDVKYLKLKTKQEVIDLVEETGWKCIRSLPAIWLY